MRDILYPEDRARPKDAFVDARKGLSKPLPKRFYRAAEAAERDGAFALLLDGRPALTPARKPLALRSRAAAELLAAEWNARVETIDPAEMPATRLANVGLDRVDPVREAVIEDIAKYARSDLVFHRAADPAGLVALESRLWNPVLDHARARHRATFVLSQGLGFAAQPETSVAAVREAVAGIADPVALAAFHNLTTLAGSVLIALAFAEGALDAEAAFDASCVEEDWNARLWGEDSEAAARRARRRAEFLASAALFRALTL